MRPFRSPRSRTLTSVLPKNLSGYRPTFEPLEDRCVMSNLWLTVFSNLPSYPTLQAEETFARDLFTAAGVTQDEVITLKALDLTGSFLIETSPNVTQQTLDTELKGVAGYRFVQDFNQARLQEADGEKSPKELSEAIFGPFDYAGFLDREANGKVPNGQGEVPGSSPADILTNNNTGSTGSAFFTQSETSVVAFGNTVLVGFNDSGSNAGGSNKFTGFSRSINGGTSFTDGGTLPTSAGGDAGDPVMARNETTGRIYFSTLGFSTPTIQVFRSDDNGATWMAPVVGTPGGSSEDKQWLAVDNNAGAGNGNVYLISRNFGAGNGIYMYRSTDNGATFGPNGGTFITSGNQGAYVAVGTDHSVYAFWWAGSTIQMRRSTDQGLTFGATVTVASGLIGGTNGDLGLVGQNNGEAFNRTIRSNSFPHAAVNPVTGAIYAVYNNRGTATGDKGDIFMVQSTNNGATWSAPVKVNDDLTTTDQWQPTLAVSPDGTKLMVNYYSREVDTTTADGDPVNNQFRYFGRIGDITGATVTFAPSFAVSPVNSKPEVGRDAVINTTYMGDYNQTAATPGAFHIVWSDNRDPLPGGGGRSDPNVYYMKVTTAATFSVVATVPANGATINTFPVSYTVDFNAPYDAVTVQASDFRVNGIAANGFILVDADTLAFTYTITPAIEGLNTMAIAAGAITGNGGLLIAPFSGTFRVDTVPLAITTTSPAPNAVIALGGNQTIRVFFNEAINPATVQLADFVVTQGTVISATPVLGNTAVDVVIAGLVTEGTLTLTIGANAFTDVNGGPNPAGFSANYVLDYVTRAYPTPLAAKNPLGSLIYDPTIAGLINFAGDQDNFTLAIDPGQTITIIVTPNSAGLKPRVDLFDPSSASLGFAAAPAAGQIAGIQTRATTTGGTYTIRVSGDAGTVGNYTVQVILNAAFELEGKVVGATNNTFTTAQAIDGSFISLDTTLAHATRGAVLGTSDTAAGYTATAVPFGFTEISGTGTHVLQNQDDSTTTISIPFTFNFYGTGYTSVGFSSNGLITFGGMDGSFSNGTLSNSPTLAAIAPFWDDLFTGANGIAWQVLGSVGSRQLVIEWDNATFFGGGTNTLKFEAVLSETSNNIQFNYQNLSNGGPGVEGSSATVGVKAANPTGSQFLELAFNNGPNAFVGTGKSTLIAAAPATADFYKFDVAAGQRVTVALTNLAAGNVDVQLIGTDGTTVLATGVAGATNLNEAIPNFLIPAAGTYFLRVSGDGSVPYSVVVTKDAVFDAEANNTLATAQTMTGSQGALGQVQGGTGSSFNFETGQQGWTVNNNIPGLGTGLWHLSTRRGAQAGHSPVTSFYYGSETTGNYDTGVANAGTITSPTFLVSAGSNLTFNYVKLTENDSFFDNVDVQVSNNNFATFTSVLPFFADAGAWTAASASLASFAGQNVQVRFSFNTQDSLFNSTEGVYIDDIAVGAVANDDWYKVTLAPGETVVEVETRTPADGTGEFVNLLNPKVQLFNAAGMDITPAVTILGDGRNEQFRAVGLTAGETYFVRVSAEGTTQGEYFVGAKTLRTPTPTVLVDNNNPLGFRVYGSGWALDATGYGGNSRSHAGGGTGANYAQWSYGQTFTAGTSYEFYVTWAPAAANATNATYKVLDGATQIGTKVVDQTLTPNTALVNGSLWQSIFTFTPTTSGYKVIRVQLSDAANGRVVADALFDPPLETADAAPDGGPSARAVPVADSAVAPVATIAAPVAVAAPAAVVAIPAGSVVDPATPAKPVYGWLGVSDGLTLIPAPVGASPARDDKPAPGADALFGLVSKTAVPPPDAFYTAGGGLENPFHDPLGLVDPLLVGYADMI